MILSGAMSYSSMTPPETPSKGDIYIIPNIALGDWADYPNEIAIYNGKEWVYIDPLEGMRIYSISQEGYLAYSNGQWKLADNGAYTPADAILAITNGIKGALAAPPSTSSFGDAYIVTSAQTSGTWNGAAVNQIAVFNTSWSFITPYIGYRIWSSATQQYFTYNGASWVITSGSGYSPADAVNAIMYGVKGIVSSAPSQPAFGDAYIVGANQTSGDWSGATTNQIASYSTQWTFITPKTGVRIWNSALQQIFIFDGTNWNASSGSGMKRAFTAWYPSTPIGGAEIMNVGSPFNLNFQANMPGGVINVGTNPTANYSASFIINGTTNVGTFTVNTSGVGTFNTSEFTLKNGDILRAISQSSLDKTVSDISFTIVGTEV